MKRKEAIEKLKQARRDLRVLERNVKKEDPWDKPGTKTINMIWELNSLMREMLTTHYSN